MLFYESAEGWREIAAAGKQPLSFLLKLTACRLGEVSEGLKQIYG